jgi:hypothetical protein
MQFRLSTRFVILFGEWALKIPLSKRGYLQGVNERKTWHAYKQTDLLVPLLWSFCGVVCQSRAFPVSSIEHEHILKVVDSIPHLNVTKTDLFNSANWGRLNGRVVLLDYGLNERVSNMY